MLNRLLLLFLLPLPCASLTSFAQDKPADQAVAEAPSHPELAAELVKMKEADQKEREFLQEMMIANQGKSVSEEKNRELQALWKKQEEADQKNQKRLAEIVEKYGWPGKRLVGSEASEGAFLILQHADQATQEKYFPMFKQAAQSGDVKASHAAMLEDRILMRQGKPQIYGTQLRSDATGRMALAPIDDEIHVDERRAKVGLPPIKDYLKLFGLDYMPPAKPL